MSGRPASRSVGRSGSSAERSAELTASATSLPACTCGITDTGGRQAKCTSPCSMAVVAWAEDAYGMCTAKDCVRSLTSSTPRCAIEPLPVEAKLYCPGLRRSAASQSLTEATPMPGVATQTFGVVAASDTGTRSVKGS